MNSVATSLEARARELTRDLDSQQRMSANNVRDVIRFFVQNGIAGPINVQGKCHFRYQLTELGKTFQLLLLRAEGIR